MKRMFSVPVLLVMVFVIASTTSVQAAPQGSDLHGEYSLIGTRTCVQPPMGGSTRTTHYNGILILFGNGSGELSAKAVLMNHNFGSFPTGQYHDVCDVTYQGLEDGTIQVKIANCLSKNLWPPPLEGTFYSFSDYVLSVTVSSNGGTLLMSDAAMEPDVENVWTCALVGGQPDCSNKLNTQERICVRSFTAIRLSPQP